MYFLTILFAFQRKVAPLQSRNFSIPAYRTYRVSPRVPPAAPVLHVRQILQYAACAQKAFQNVPQGPVESWDLFYHCSVLCFDYCVRSVWK
jgi:hypothetical protein